MFTKVLRSYYSPRASRRRRYDWDIGTAGSATLLALAVLPVLAVNITAVQVELKGGLFQDFAPSFHHLRYVMIPLLQRMGIDAVVEMVRPGYVPLGQGILRLSTNPIRHGLRPLVAAGAEVEGLWGVALPSHLEQRTVSDRMASSAGKALGSAATAQIFRSITIRLPSSRAQRSRFSPI